MKTNAYLIAETDRSMSAVKQYASKSIELYFGCLNRYDKFPIPMSTIYNLDLGLNISCVNNQDKLRKMVDNKKGSLYIDEISKSIFMEQLADVPYVEFVKAIDDLKRDSVRQGRKEKITELKKALDIE